MKRLLIVVLAIVMVFTLAACAQGGKSDAGPDEQSEEGNYKFGYVLNDMSHEWYQNIAKGAKARAEALGHELEVTDAAMDTATQINQLENFIAKGVDVLIVTPVDVKALAPVMKQAADEGIPVITESNVVEGAMTYVGIDNKAGGKKAGEWFAAYAKENNIEPKLLIVELPAFEDCRLRVEGFLEGLDDAGVEYEISARVDGQGSKEESLRVSQDALTAHPEINVIFGINDNSTTGAMAAYKEAGYDESALTAIGFGFEGVVGRDALLSGGPYKAAVAMFPDYMGVSVVDAAIMAAAGEELPDNYQSGTVVITNDNFDEYYTKDGDSYITNFEAIDALLGK